VGPLRTGSSAREQIYGQDRGRDLRSLLLDK
jgi:hypothetical protein